LTKQSQNIQDRSLPLPSPMFVTPYGASNAAMCTYSPNHF